MIALVLVIALAQGPRDLTGQLGDDDIEQREAATRALEEMGWSALSALEEAAQSDDPEVRTRAEAALRVVRQTMRYGGRVVPDRLEELARRLGKKASVREEDRVLLQDFHLQEGDLPYLLALLDRTRPVVSKWPEIDSLALLGEIAKLPIDEADEQRLVTILTPLLPRLSDPPTQEELNTFETYAGFVEDLPLPCVLRAFDKSAQAGYRALAHAGNSSQRRNAIKGLVRWVTDDPEVEIARCLLDQDAQVRMGALASLRSYDTSAIRDPLRGFMRATSDEGERLASQELLARAGDFCAFAALCAALWSEEECYRHVAVDSLLRLRGRRLHHHPDAGRDIDALRSWWAENGEIVHWDPLLKTFVAR